MGQFKPMVKMMTTEPSVILKLKKGGKVASKMDGGYMPMQSTMPAQMPASAGAPMGMAPKRPSMMARRRAMNPNLMMKKGGEASCETVEKELKEHEGKSASKAHKGMKHGGKMATGGVINGQGGYKKGGGVAGNGIIKTEGQGGEYRNTKVVTAKTDHSPAKTGDVKMGNGGGYKTGGVAKSNAGGYKDGGMTMVKKNGKMVPDFAADGKGKMKDGGMMMGGKTSKKAYATGGTVDSGKPVAMPKKAMSRPVANSMQSGTFAKGGKVNFYSDLAKKLEKNPEKPNLRLIKTHTGPKGHVAKVYKDRDYGEYRTKFYSPEGKHLTEGDSHTDDSEDAHMTAKHEVNRGYAKGGKAKKYADGSRVTPAGDPKVVTDKASRELEDALNPLGMIKEGAQKVRDYFTSKPAPAGSVTKTEKSVTVAPRKRGGRAC